MVIEITENYKVYGTASECAKIFAQNGYNVKYTAGSVTVTLENAERSTKVLQILEWAKEYDNAIYNLLKTGEIKGLGDIIRRITND